MISFWNCLRNWRCLAWRKKTVEPEYHLQMFGGLSHRRGIRRVPYGPKEVKLGLVGENYREILYLHKRESLINRSL